MELMRASSRHSEELIGLLEETNTIETDREELIGVTIGNALETNKNVLERENEIKSKKRENTDKFFEMSASSTENNENPAFETNIDTEENAFLDNSSEGTVRTKKHKISVTMRRMQTKLKRLKGKTYEGYKKNANKILYVQRNARTLKPRCAHTKLLTNTNPRSFLCASISDDERTTIFTDFWKLKSWNEKKLYVKDRVVTRPIRRQRKNVQNSENRKKTVGHDYYLGEHTKVCRVMFLNTLSLGEDSLKRWATISQKIAESDTSRETVSEAGPSHPKEKKNLTRRKKEQEKLLNVVKEWLSLIPKVPSHYCRSSSNRHYVDNSFISKQNMYRIFESWCSENQKNATNLKAFKSILKEEKISVHKPRKDQCDTCIGYQCGNISADEYAKHIRREKAAREKKNILKLGASSKNRVVTMDLESVLTCPRLLAGQSYYKLKLQLHNFTIYSLHDRNVSLYVWHEANGGVSSNEFASCIIDYLTKELENDSNIEIFTLISDGCNYQNRNKTLASALSDFAVERQITIQQLFLEKGHTMMEADSVHSTLEHYFYPPINSPMDYIARMRLARPKKPYKINVLDYSFFRKFETSTNFCSIRPGKRTRDPVVVDIRQIKYTFEGIVYYTLDCANDWEQLPIQRKSQPLSQYGPLYVRSIPISTDKYKHLQELKLDIEKDHHPFYDALTHKAKPKKK